MGLSYSAQRSGGESLARLRGCCTTLDGVGELGTVRGGKPVYIVKAWIASLSAHHKNPHKTLRTLYQFGDEVH